MPSHWLADNSIRISALTAAGRPDPGAVLVRWSAPLDGRIFQVYVNSRLAASTSRPADRRIIVPTDGAELLAVAVRAVELNEAGEDFSHELPPRRLGRQALLRWPIDTAAPLGSTVAIFGNGGAGNINYDAPLNRVPVAGRPAGSAPSGFGLCHFGQAGFGLDETGAVGFGRGGFGFGCFGLDAAWQSWLSRPLPAGTHRFAAVAFDHLGNPAQTVAEVELAIPPPPARPRNLATQLVAGRLTVSWDV